MLRDNDLDTQGGAFGLGQRTKAGTLSRVRRWAAVTIRSNGVLPGQNSPLIDLWIASAADISLI